MNKTPNFIESDPLQNEFENQQEQEKLLIKIYEDNLDKITNSAKKMQISQLISIITFLCFLIILAIKLCPFSKFSWLYLLIPLIISVVSVVISLNMFLELKGIIDQADLKKQTSQKGNSFSYALLNCTGFFVIVFIILLMLYLDGKISSRVDLNMIFIPFYFGITLCIIYAVFISPAFVHNGLYSELIILFCFLFSSFLFCALLALKINNYKKAFKFFYVFIPAYFFVGLTFVYLLFNCFMNLKNDPKKNPNNNSKRDFVSNCVYVIGTVFVFVGCLLVQLKNDNLIKNHENFIEIIMYILGFCCWTGENMINMINLLFDFSEKDEEDIENNNFQENNQNNIY